MLKVIYAVFPREFCIFSAVTSLIAHPRIRALSDATVHKIAAGEVIERPANVVKELVENALDAGATRITVSIEEGGKELIKVADNGFGMGREDARACWLPHTTSKIREVEDLDQIVSFGFRGEALCSMAAVGELTIETRPEDEEIGTWLRVEEGRELEIRDLARIPGTTFTLRHLFLNNPVRRKFLGTARSESTRVLTILTRLCLAHPGVAFRLLEKNRELLSLREGGLRHRVGEILGFHASEDLLPVLFTDGLVHVEGFVSAPDQARQRASHQYLYVNGRNVHSPALSRALLQSYEVLPPGRHPVAALFLTIPAREIDINIHPTKREIRFLHESRVFWAVSQGVTQALRLVGATPRLDLTLPEAFSISSEPTFSASATHDLGEDEPADSLNAGQPQKQTHFTGDPALAPTRTGAPNAPPPVYHAFRLEDHVEPGAQGRIAPKDNQGSMVATPTELGLFAKASLSQQGTLATTPYLQIHNGFIVFAVSSGLMVVNQQAAHERVLFERALEDLRRPGRFSSQQLLFPEVVELLPEEAGFAESHLTDLQALGFDLEPFGGNTFQVRGLPAEVSAERSRRVLQELLQDLLNAEGKAVRATEDLHNRIARAYSKVTCIRQGEPLDTPRMAALMDALFATQNPYVAPSGNPVVIRFSLDDLNRRFGLKPSL